MLKETTYKIRIESEDASVRVYMDGNLMGALDDASFSKGTIGLANGSLGTALFDNLVALSSLIEFLFNRLLIILV